MERIKELFTNLNKTDLKIMKFGIIFSLIISIIGTFILSYNLIFLHTLLLYKIGLSILKLSFYFAVEFIVCGFIVDKIIFENS